MKQIGITVYVEAPKRPQLRFEIAGPGKPVEAGEITQSRIFTLNDGERLTLEPILGSDDAQTAARTAP